MLKLNTSVLKFKLWLEDYEQYRSRVQDIAGRRDFPFANWFADKSLREYIPFTQSGESRGQKGLEDVLGEEGYQVTDYRAGLASKGGRVFRIGKILSQLQARDAQVIQQRLAADQISAVTAQTETRKNQRYYGELQQSFQNDPRRIKALQYYVVISGDPHDIAQMSTGRGWTSCMDLAGTGEQSEDVYCEVEKGGLVAYLIKAQDREIKKPIARIHIRRFDSKSGWTAGGKRIEGKSIAMPEESIYGNEVPGFLDVVKRWLASKQGNITPGVYRRAGGEHSDTFERGKQLIGPDPNDKKTIRGWIKKWLKMESPQKIKFMHYFTNAMEALLKSDTEGLPKSFLTQLRDAIFDDDGNIGITSVLRKYRGQFAIRNPKLIDKELFYKAYQSSSLSVSKQTELLKAFPQFVNAELYAKAKTPRSREDIRKLGGGELDQVGRAQASSQIERELKTDNPDFQATKEHSVWQVVGTINDTLEDLKLFNPIPEPLLRKVVDFATNIDELQLVDPQDARATDLNVSARAEGDANQAKIHILNGICHIFKMTDSDSPTVQGFYKSLLPNWKEMGSTGSFLSYSIAALGRNGRDFLPFLRDKLEKVQAYDAGRHEEAKEQAIENYMAMIDAIENGTGRSTKYTMSSYDPLRGAYDNDTTNA